MRVPVTKADWPKSFNALSKYIGRHWPTGKLKLATARETTARLLGYNSVHDLNQELLDSVPEQHWSTETAASSMAVKAVLLFGQPPIDSLRLFNSMPWPNLTTWSSAIEKKIKDKNRMLLLDECWDVMNYVTPALLADAFVQRKLPPYKYVITHQGTMYYQSEFETLLGRLEPDKDALLEAGYKYDVEAYFAEHILPLAFAPIEEVVSRLNPEKPFTWLTPAGVEVIKTEDDQYALFNLWLDACYPGTYSPDELRLAIKRLFLFETIADFQKMPSADEGSRRGIVGDIKGEKVQLFDEAGRFESDGQVFYRRRPEINDYQSKVGHPFIQFLVMHIKNPKSYPFPEGLFPEEQHTAIKQADCIRNGLMAASSPFPADVFDLLDIQATLAVVYGEKHYDKESFMETFESCLRMDLEDGLELSSYLAFCQTLGNTIVSSQSEWAPYYDSQYIGHVFYERYLEELEEDDDSYQWENVDLDTVANIIAVNRSNLVLDLISDHLCRSSDFHFYGYASHAVYWLLVATAKDVIGVTDIAEEFYRIVELFNMVEDDRRVLENMGKYPRRPHPCPDNQYLDQGDTYTPKLKPDTNGFPKELGITRSRKWSYGITLMSKDELE